MGMPVSNNTYVIETAKTLSNTAALIIIMWYCVRLVPQTASVTTVLSQLVVKNAVELMTKSAKLRLTAGAAALDRVGPPIEPSELVAALENAVHDEINVLAVEHPDMTLVMSDRVVAGTTEAEQVRQLWYLMTRSLHYNRLLTNML